MPKRYYCDFCDKAFADNPVARKNHMNGVMHQRNRKQHYDSFRDPEIILFEEVNKKPCKHFMQTGKCNFMDTCRFSHLTEDEKEKLKMEVSEMKMKKSKTNFETDEFHSDNVNDEHNEETAKKFVEKLTKKYKSDSHPSTIHSGVVLPKYSVPPFLQTLPNLPPSLIPPTPDSYLELELVEWG